MEVLNSIESIKKKSSSYYNEGYCIGLVPTMGALHNGHLSLISAIRNHVDKIIVSIFVNKKQFSENEDFDSYPRSIESDCKKCRESGVDVVYIPTDSEMYLPDFSTTVSVGPLSKELCGSSRKNYFDGIMVVILKLIMQINPKVMIFGEKDYQMLFLIKKMLKDLNIEVKVLQAPTVREPDGLALSSRNEYLNTEQRCKANYLYNTLVSLSKEIKKNLPSFNHMITDKKDFLTQNGFVVDYLEVRNNNTLEKVTDINNTTSRIFAAAYLGKCRLIDNLLIT